MVLNLVGNNERRRVCFKALGKFVLFVCLNFCFGFRDGFGSDSFNIVAARLALIRFRNFNIGLGFRDGLVVGFVVIFINLVRFGLSRIIIGFFVSCRQILVYGSFRFKFDRLALERVNDIVVLPVRIYLFRGNIERRFFGFGRNVVCFTLVKRRVVRLLVRLLGRIIIAGINLRLFGFFIRRIVILRLIVLVGHLIAVLRSIVCLLLLVALVRGRFVIHDRLTLSRLVITEINDGRLFAAHIHIAVYNRSRRSALTRAACGIRLLACRRKRGRARVIRGIGFDLRRASLGCGFVCRVECRRTFGRYLLIFQIFGNCVAVDNRTAVVIDFDGFCRQHGRRLDFSGLNVGRRFCFRRRAVVHVGRCDYLSRLIISRHPGFGIAEQNLVSAFSVILLVGKVRLFARKRRLRLLERRFFFVYKLVETARLREISFLFVDSAHKQTAAAARIAVSAVVRAERRTAAAVNKRIAPLCRRLLALTGGFFTQWRARKKPRYEEQRHKSQERENDI